MNANKSIKVLIALDYDTSAKKVAEEGFIFAESIGAEVILFHVVVDLKYYSLSYLNMGPLQLDAVEEIKESAQKFLDKTKKYLGDETIKTLIGEGDFADAILETAEENQVDVIVIGSHSKKWLEDIILGTVTEKVLRKSIKPILIIKTKKHS